jgi:ribosomal-protein-alanine N-acetyltransferase
MNARLDTPPVSTPVARPLLRALEVSDVDAIVAVEVRAYAFAWSRGNFIDSLAAGYLARVAHDGEGHVLGYFIAMPGVDELHLLNLTVSPDHQGQGHGRALLEAVIDAAQALPVSKLLLEVRESNQRARQLYAARGFAEIGRRRGYYPARERREDAIVMGLALEARDGLG